MPSFAGLQKFFGRTVSEGAAFAAGVAVAPALSPVVREVVNEANAKYQSHPLDPGTAAAIVAENVDELPWGEQEAKYSGVSPGRFDRLYQEALNAPGVPELLTLWRRGEISEADFVHGLRKAKQESRWDTPVKSLKTDRLDPSVVASAIQRGIMRAPFTLPKAPPTASGKVPAFPVSNIDAATEAAASGIDVDRLFVETALVGNPPGAVESAHALFRGLIDQADFDRAIAEGRTRNEWGDTIRDVARQIPSVTNYVEAFVRNWITRDEMIAGAAKHGMTEEDATLLFLVHGRPATAHQVFIGLRRGGVYDGPTGHIPQPILKAMQEANLRPEWYNPLYAGLESYPSAFVLRAMTQSGDLTEAETLKILLYEGWNEDLAKTVAAKWATPTTSTKTDPAVKSAETKFLTAIHKATVGGAITSDQAKQQLALTSLSAQAQAGVLDYFEKERALQQIKPPPA